MKREYQEVSTYWSRLGAHFVDVFLTIGLIALVRPVIKYLIFWGGPVSPLVKLITPELLEKAIWPVFFIVVGLLLRDVIVRTLYQLPGFVARSDLRDLISTGKKAEEAAYEEDGPTEARAEGPAGVQHEIRPGATPDAKEQRNTTVLTGARISRGDAIRYENQIICAFERDFDCKVVRGGRLKGTSFSFDGMFECDGELYAIEIKCGFNRQVLFQALRQIRCVIEELPIKTRNLLNVIFCVVSNRDDEEWKDEVRKMVYESGLNARVRLFQTQELQEEV